MLARVSTDLFSQLADDNGEFAADRSEVWRDAGCFSPPQILDVHDRLTGGHRLFQLVAEEGTDFDTFQWRYRTTEYSEGRAVELLVLND